MHKYTRILLFLLLSQNIVFAQSDSLRKLTGVVLDEQTGKSITNTTIKIYGTDGSSMEKKAGNLNYFSLELNPKVKYKVEVSLQGYVTKHLEVKPGDQVDTLVFKLRNGQKADYFPEFTFDKNSSQTKDTSNFYEWDLNNYRDTIILIKVTGFNAPDEAPELALKRANNIIETFVIKGANRNSFVAEVGIGFPVGDGKVMMSPEGKPIPVDEALNMVSQEDKVAAYDYLRRVQLSWR